MTFHNDFTFTRFDDLHSNHVRRVSMAKRLKNYLIYIQEQSEKNMTTEERSSVRADLLIQISFFQHERLIHLIVTVTFAILTIVSMCCSFFYQNAGLCLLILLFLILLVPYIMHYYLLENGVQKLYTYYDKLK